MTFDDVLLTELCRTTLHRLSSTFHDKDINAAFYPYIGLTHKIRRRGTSWTIRISDHCRSASREVLEAIIVILACKVLRRRAPETTSRAYEQFRREPAVQSRLTERRLQRGRKLIRDSHGKCHSLDAIFRRLNQQFFNGQLEISRLGWGTRKSWSRLGHYDPVHHTITISPVLDSPKVPESVVAYLLYHEMLHSLFDSNAGTPRQRYHTREFYRAERSFPGYAFAKKVLDDFCHTRGRVHRSWLGRLFVIC